MPLAMAASDNYKPSLPQTESIDIVLGTPGYDYAQRVCADNAHSVAPADIAIVRLAAVITSA